MHLNALLDVDVVAVEAEDELSILLELQAPTSKTQATRPPHTLVVVLDRSGSMDGGPLDAAKAALHALVGRLDAQDRFGLVTFDHDVEVAVPCAPLTDRDVVRNAVDGVYARGATNLSSGLVRGIELARDAKGDGGATVLLLSDGCVNGGESDPAKLGRFAQTVREEGTTITTIGIGLHYDETILAAISAGGAGNAHFAETTDEITGALGQEVDGLLDQVVQAASLTVRPGDAVRSVQLFNDLPVSEIDGGFVVELGDFVGGEERRLLLRVDVPAMAGLGLASVCDLRLRWTDVDTLQTQTVDVPVHVNVVPGDQAAGRMANPTVRTEFEYQRAQKSRKEAAEALSRGDRGAASDLLRNAGVHLQASMAAAPADMVDELRDESELLMQNAHEALHEDAGRSAKRNRADYDAKALKRRYAAAREAERAIEEERRRGEDGDGKWGPLGA